MSYVVVALCCGVVLTENSLSRARVEGLLAPSTLENRVAKTVGGLPACNYWVYDVHGDESPQDRRHQPETMDFCGERPSKSIGNNALSTDARQRYYPGELETLQVAVHKVHLRQLCLCKMRLALARVLRMAVSAGPGVDCFHDVDVAKNLSDLLAEKFGGALHEGDDDDDHGDDHDDDDHDDHVLSWGLCGFTCERAVARRWARSEGCMVLP